MVRTRSKAAVLALLALILFARPVSAGCAASRDCCGGHGCECQISPGQCNAAVSQSVPVRIEAPAGSPAAPVSFSAISPAAFTAAVLAVPHYFYLASINNHPPTGPPLS